MVVDKDSPEVKSEVAIQIANKAIDLALRALSKVEAMEKSTQKAYFVTPQEIAEMNPQHPHEPGASLQMSEEEMNQKLDELFDSVRPEEDN